MYKFIILLCLILFSFQSLDAYSIPTKGDKIYTTVQSVVFKTYQDDMVSDPNSASLNKITVLEFELRGKMWSDLSDTTTLIYGECNSAAKIQPNFENVGFNNALLEAQVNICSKDLSKIIYPELNDFAAVGFIYLDILFITTLPNGEYDVSFQIEGVPPENHGHSRLVVNEDDISLIVDPLPKGWGIDTHVSFDLNFPYQYLLYNLLLIHIIRRKKMN